MNLSVSEAAPIENVIVTIVLSFLNIAVKKVIK